MRINPKNSTSNTLTANGMLIYELTNLNMRNNEYTVQIAGNFGSGTVTAFTNPQGAEAAKAGTTYDIPIKDADGAISLTANGSFFFHCDSSSADPTVLKIVLASSTSPDLIVKVDNGV